LDHAKNLGLMLMTGMTPVEQRTLPWMKFMDDRELELEREIAIREQELSSLRSRNKRKSNDEIVAKLMEFGFEYKEDDEKYVVQIDDNIEYIVCLFNHEISVLDVIHDNQIYWHMFEDNDQLLNSLDDFPKFYLVKQLEVVIEGGFDGDCCELIKTYQLEKLS